MNAQPTINTASLALAAAETVALHREMCAAIEVDLDIDGMIETESRGDWSEFGGFTAEVQAALRDAAE